jgi:hypothetical protein
VLYYILPFHCPIVQFSGCLTTWLPDSTNQPNGRRSD